MSPPDEVARQGPFPEHRASDGGVRLYEKGGEGVGKDIRTWQISPDGVGFIATPH
ncbi:hypothetical protein [Cellulomonas edaphi]|uniref:Uncharacterized protein n=1 Tax=Cellulomonas edaphi TaxID=3053468 RepID=A0ABT7S6I0_9CELL|nr:hypothetical protein [Cellulomons edaphi]MDM7831114.1 hypothetical protein [Cellulomons edaphi]